MDAVRYTADTVANADYHFEKKKVPQRVSGFLGQRSTRRRCSSCCSTPNPYMDYIEMMELLVIDLLLVGNAYWFKWQVNDAGPAARALPPRAAT
jgi:phage portal protein BeeE